MADKNTSPESIPKKSQDKEGFVVRLQTGLQTFMSIVPAFVKAVVTLLIWLAVLGTVVFGVTSLFRLLLHLFLELNAYLGGAA